MAMYKYLKHCGTEVDDPEGNDNQVK